MINFAPKVIVDPKNLTLEVWYGDHKNSTVKHKNKNSYLAAVTSYIAKGFPIEER